MFVFGLFHGLGLATKLQEFVDGSEGLFVNLAFFNIGVEIGQVLALLALFLILFSWRRSENFNTWGNLANVLLHCGMPVDRLPTDWLHHQHSMNTDRSEFQNLSPKRIVVLPAEFGFDPLQTGKLLGIKGMSQERIFEPLPQSEAPRQKILTVELQPFKSTEIKFELQQGSSLIFLWSSDQELLYELHAEPEGSERGYADSFDRNRTHSSIGTYIAPYDGIHGWFWGNRTTSAAAMTL